jgi:hypothetical protein
MQLLGQYPDTAVMSLSVWNRIRRSTKLQTYLYGTLNTNAGGSAITTQMFAQAFGIKRVLVSTKAVDVAAKGLTASLTSIWGNTYMSLIEDW